MTDLLSKSLSFGCFNYIQQPLSKIWSLLVIFALSNKYFFYKYQKTKLWENILLKNSQHENWAHQRVQKQKKQNITVIIT